MIVPRFPRVSETFIVSKFAGLIDAGWDVHIVCGQVSMEDWGKFPLLASRPELQGRVHREWQHEPRWTAILLWLPVFLLTILRAPQATWHYWRQTWPRFGRLTAKRFYLDAAIIVLRPEIIHFEFGTLAIGRTYLKRSLNCHFSASLRGYDLNYVGLNDPDYYSRLWEDADALHVLGRDLWARALRRGCPPDKPHALIPPAVHVEYFVRDKASRLIDPISVARPLRILSVGRLEWKKGYEYALQAVSLLGERGIPFQYDIIGDGDYLEPLAFIRHELGLEDRVHFLGSQPHRSVVEEMNRADVFLHAAVSEGFCNAVLEAQAMELPVVSSDADGLPENVADGRTGFIVPRRDPAALAAKLMQLAGDADLRSEMGAAGRIRVENCFSLSQQIAAFDHYYRSVVSNRAD